MHLLLMLWSAAWPSAQADCLPIRSPIEEVTVLGTGRYFHRVWPELKKCRVTVLSQGETIDGASDDPAICSASPGTTARVYSDWECCDVGWCERSGRWAWTGIERGFRRLRIVEFRLATPADETFVHKLGF